MRGIFQDQGGLFSYISLEERVPDKHPLRKVRELVGAVLIDLNKDFAAIYADEGRPPIPPEQLLSALLLQVFYGLRPERQLMEQLDYNLLLLKAVHLPRAGSFFFEGEVHALMASVLPRIAGLDALDLDAEP